MADYRCNKLPIINGATITVPRVGAWTADLKVDTDAPLVNPLVITIGETAALVGSALRQEAKHGVVDVRVVGGAGGLGKLVSPKHYTQPTIRSVLRDILKDAGETLASDASAASLDVYLDHYTSVPVPAAKAIETLIAHAPAGTIWRINAAGQVWVGVDAFADSGIVDPRETDHSPAEGWSEYALEQPTLWPGVSLAGRRVDYVEHSLGEKTRSRVWFQDGIGGTLKDRAREAFAANARAAMPTPIYFGTYPAKVVKQSGDLSLVDVIPLVTETLPPMSNVPIRIGVPGVRISVEPGAFVMVGWDGGDPAKAYAGLWGVAAVKDVITETEQSHLGSEAASEPMVLGNKFNSLVWTPHFHATPFGPTSPTATPMQPALSLKHKLDL